MCIIININIDIMHMCFIVIISSCISISIISVVIRTMRSSTIGVCISSFIDNANA